MISIPTYAEFLGTDAGTFDVASYLSGHVHSRLWWQTFSAPVLAGLLFLLTASCAPRLMRDVATDLPLLIACVLLSGILAFAISGVAIFAVVVSSMLLIVEIFHTLRQRRQRDGR